MLSYTISPRMRTTGSLAITALTCVLTLCTSTTAPAALTYEKDIRPILKINCFRCHGEAGELKGKLDLRLRRLILQGGKSGPAIVPGNARESKLYELVST